MILVDKINYRILDIAIFIGLIGIIVAAILGNIILLGIIVLFPAVFVLLFLSISKPIIFWFVLIMINYLIMGIGRYVEIPNVSVIMDAFLIFEFIILCVHGIQNRTIKWGNLNCILCIGTFIWACYCFLEIANPTADTYAWFASKNLIYNPLLISIVTIIAITKKVYLRVFIYIFAILVFIAVIKTVMQRFIGFDEGERYWLEVGGGKTTHIISSGIRYFSIFTDAGNMGSNMGHASFFFGVIGIYSSKNFAKIGFFILSALALYALGLSGTRGAVIVPIGGIVVFAILSRSRKLMLLGSSVLLIVYVFFAFTYIAHDNYTIRRMRTAFVNPTADASFRVRINNQEKLADYMKDRWFGEGLGLSGVENQELHPRFTTSIPNDSWLVKVWVETGIIGLILYLTILLIIFLNCCYITMFKVHDKQLKGFFIALIGGIFGLILSSYGNPFFGQYPTHYIVYISFAIIANYKYFIVQEENKDKCLY